MNTVSALFGAFSTKAGKRPLKPVCSTGEHGDHRSILVLHPEALPTATFANFCAWSKANGISLLLKKRLCFCDLLKKDSVTAKDQDVPQPDLEAC